MDANEHVKQADVVNRQSWRKFFAGRDLSRSRPGEPNNYPAHNRSRKHYRNYIGLSTLILFIAPVANAADVGGVSATANPVAQTSGSQTNLAVQNLQGPYIQSAVGGGVVCQGPVLSFSPFVHRSFSWQMPYEASYMDPVYDNSDRDEDGYIDNPGSILYFKDTRTGQKDSHNWNFGFSASITIPLDGGIQERCKSAMDTQTRIQLQTLRNKELDWNLARLRHCGELAQKGITFAKHSKMYGLCSDIAVVMPRTEIPPHSHKVSFSSIDHEQLESRGSASAADDDAPEATQP